VKKTKQILHDTLAMVDKLKSYKTPASVADHKVRSEVVINFVLKLKSFCLRHVVQRIIQIRI
jgi:hypothetical protein